MIVRQNPDELFNYLEDTSNLKGRASLLYLPQNSDEVAQSVRELSKKRIPFTVSAGRTGTTGGCVPLQGAVLSLEKLNRIIDIDVEKQTVRLEAGVSLENLESQVNRFNLTLRASPTESLACVGGTISTSASGVRGFGYSGIRDYVKEIEVILPSGEVLIVRRGKVIARQRNFYFEYAGRQYRFSLPSYRMPAVKSQAGYFAKDNMDLIDLFIGSEGTLGVITSCVLSLQRLPFDIFDALVFFPKEELALSFVDTIKKHRRSGIITPASLEFFDKNSLEMLKGEYSFIPAAECAVYIEQEVESEELGGPLLEKWQAFIEESGASPDESILADTPALRKKVFEFRHRLPQLINEFLRQKKQIKAATDIAVSWENFPKMYGIYKDVAGRSGIDYVNFGHIGESHLHFNFLPHNDNQAQKAQGCIEHLCRSAVSLGGTVSAEHGIGKIKKPYLGIMFSRKELEEMADLKKYFDPDCLLGLDNIFDRELLHSGR
jgi:D-lactate dehydrogenase (cytochrome)